MLIECILLSTTICHAVRDKPVMALAVLQAATLTADGITTRNRVRRGYTESDPVVRLVLGNKPTWARMAPLGAAQCILETWLAERMHTSRHKWLRRFWWVPQSIGIGASVWGTQVNVKALRALH